ncbi:MAG: cell division ATP-binding protein FtsE, partial [Flavobacteriaceae bacterium]
VEGDFVYLIGRTGTGKSSLLKTLYGDLKLREGKGKVVDCELLKLRERHIPDLRRQLGVVFQDFQLLPDRSVEKNLDFVLRATGWKSADKRKDRINEVLGAVGLEDKLKFFPHELSGGEQQRIAISRALLNKPKLILADEPTGNLDPITSEEVMKLLHEINQQGTTILMATHDFGLISKFPKRTLMCEDQLVVEVKK